MKAEKNPQKEPVASLPNPGRRRLLRDVLVVFALAPIACKSETDSTKRQRVYQNREFPLGSSRIVFEGCKNENGIQSAHFKIHRKGIGRLPDSVSMLVPSLFKIREGETEYEVNVEGVSCSGIQSADLLIVKKSIPAENSQLSSAIKGDIPVFASALSLIGAFILIAMRRKPEPEEERGIPLSPKRPHS